MAPKPKVDHREGQPRFPCTVNNAFDATVYSGVAERVAWGMWACLNGVPHSWICSMLYEEAMMGESTTLLEGFRKLKRMIRVMFHPDKCPYGSHRSGVGEEVHLRWSYTSDALMSLVMLTITLSDSLPHTL